MKSKYGAKLTVREGQAAVFVHEGPARVMCSPGLYMLETKRDMPVMTTCYNTGTTALINRSLQS